MLPRNIVETRVRETLVARREGSADGSPCWCPLCLLDMQALALSSLPPKYVTRREDRATIGPSQHEAVEEEVDRAVRWVGSHPKHPPGEEPRTAGPVALVNFAYEVGFARIEERTAGTDCGCGCFACRCDAIAFALNRFPARYGVAVGGRVALGEEARRELGAELVPFLDLGLQVAARVPRH